MPQRILGLDLGATAVRAVVLESSYRTYAVTAAAAAPVAPLAEGGPPLRDRQLEAARALLAAPELAFDTALVAVPGASALHVVTLPFTDPRRIEQTIGFEVEGQIPFDLAEVAWDWQQLRTLEGKTELLVAVVRKEELAALLAGLASVSVDPRAVVPPGPAYAALFGAGVLAGETPSPEGAHPAAEALVEVEPGRASLCVVANGVCEAARTFPAGPAMAVGPIAREVRATLRAWRGRAGPAAAPLRRLLLAGEAPFLAGLAEALQADVDGPIEPLALAGPAVERIDPAEAPAFALALALALRGHQGSRGPRLNLRRGELAFTRDFQHVRGKVVRLATWAALVLLLAVVSSGVKVFALSRQERLLDGALCDATQKLIGKCYENDELAVAALRGKGTAAASIPRNSAVDVFMELSARTPQDFWLKLDRIEITRDKLHLQGITDAAENVDRIVSSLRGSRCFGDARSGGARKRSSDGKFEFTIDSDLTCDTGEKPAGRT
jgi:general secretion pathway protein L